MIPTFSPVYHIDECISQIRECLEKGWTGQGFKTTEFEEKWKEYTGLSHAYFLCNATAGLNLALRILKEDLGWEDDDEVISTPITFVATNNSILYNNMKPIMADIDKTLCLDPNDVERKITNKTKAVIFVGLGGNIGNYKKIVELCNKHGLRLILDAAHMSGTRYRGKTPGYEADAVVYSYHVTKTLTTADSGMVCFKDAKYDEKIRKMAWNGMDKTSSPSRYNRHYKWKINVPCVVDAYNGNSVMAAIALAQLPHLDYENEERRRVARVYREAFAGVDEIKMVEEPEGLESAQWLFQILVENRDGLMDFMAQNGVQCALHYLDNTEYTMYEHLHGNCPYAEYVSDHVISLPMHLRLKQEDIEKIIGLVKEFVRTKE